MIIGKNERKLSFVGYINVGSGKFKRLNWQVLKLRRVLGKVTGYELTENPLASWCIVSDAIRTKPKTVKHLEISPVGKVQHPWEENHKRS